MSIFTRLSSAVARCFLAATLLGACVGTELAAPSNHPGNPQARSGTVPTFTALTSDFDTSHDSPDTGHDGAASTGTAHAHGASAASGTQPSPSTGDSSVRYTCPMHPEIDVPRPGVCPKCGMKLVPKKDKP
jgi:hypothetical protein